MAASQKIKLPELPDNAPGRPPKERYREQYGVIVLVPDESAQKTVFEDLTKQGHTCRVVVT